MVVFNKKDTTLKDFLISKEGSKNSGLSGGVQGAQGTMASITYEPGSFFDRLVEAYGGTHDVIGGQITGLYDEQGNTRRGMSDSQRIAYEVWSATAIPIATPFSLATLLPADTWNSVVTLLNKGIK